jgi:hypothetical protein
MDGWVSIPDRGNDFFLFTTVSRPAVGPTQPPIQWVSWALTPWVRLPVREADQSPPPTANVKNAWSSTYILQNVFMVCCLVSTGTILPLFYLWENYLQYISHVLIIQISSQKFIFYQNDAAYIFSFLSLKHSTEQNDVKIKH